MPSTPSMEFLFDSSWPTSTATTFLTANRVWFPLAAMTMIFLPLLLI